MALLTTTAVSGAAGPITIAFPVDATLSAREIVAVGFGAIPGATAVKHEIAISNVLLAGGLSFTAQFSQEAATSSGFVKDLPAATFIVLAANPATITYTGSGATTGAAWVAYNQIPKCGAAGS